MNTNNRCRASFIVVRPLMRRDRPLPASCGAVANPMPAPKMIISDLLLASLLEIFFFFYPLLLFVNRVLISFLAAPSRSAPTSFPLRARRRTHWRWWLVFFLVLPSFELPPPLLIDCFAEFFYGALSFKGHPFPITSHQAENCSVVSFHRAYPAPLDPSLARSFLQPLSLMNCFNRVFNVVVVVVVGPFC